MDEKDLDRELCICCRWCGLRLRPGRWAEYFCERTGESVEDSVLHGLACECFQQKSAAPHWGP